MAEARWRDWYDASAVEKGELAAQLQAEAGANAALRRELRQAVAVTAVREAEETVATETATTKAGEGRISSRLGRHAGIPESDPGIQFGSGAPAGEDPPLISFGTVDSAPRGASAVDSVGRVPGGSDTPASGTNAISDEPQAKSVTKSAPTSAKPGGAKSATPSAPTSAQPGEDETQGTPTSAKPGKAETQAKSAQKAPRQSPKPNDVKARGTRAKPSAPQGGDKAPGERAKPDQAKSAKPSAKPGPIRSGVDGRSPGGTSNESPSGLTRGQKKAFARRRAAERAAQTALLAARDEAGSRAYHLEAKAEVAAACAADAAAAARELKARAATAATNHVRNVKSRAKKTKAAGGQAVMATPGRGTTTVRRGHSGATVAEAKCAVPGASTVEEAKVTGPGKPNATSVVTETEVQSTAVAETAVEAEAAGDAEADLAPRGLNPWGSKDYTWQPMVQTKAPKPRKLFFLDGPFASCLATVPEEADPAESQEMEEEKEAGEGDAFPARGDRCCRVITPDHMGLGRQRPSFVVRAGERERAELVASSPHEHFLYSPDRGKAIVDLYTKGKISVWDSSPLTCFF